MQHSKTKLDLSLSSFNHPELSSSALIGSCSLNVTGFLDLLETRLGVNSKPISFTTRLVDYLYCLERTDNPKAFYQASYKQDPFAVARKLLLWRDELYMAGWTGRFETKDNLSKRLLDIETVESLAQTEVAPSLGQRFQYVLSRLSNDNVFISEVKLQDKLEHFLPLVQKVIAATGAKIVHPGELTPNAVGDTDLRRLQNIILSPNTTAEFANDGSVLLIETDEARASHQLTAQIIAANYSTDSKTDIAVICETDGHIVDEALETIGLPRAGFTENSSWRPVFQVMPLSMELLWKPVNPAKILQFLTNPVCPLPGRVRYSLGNVMAQTPGLGSDVWNERVQKILSKEDDKKKQKKIETDIKFWIENERFDPETGAPVTEIITRLTAVSKWLGNMMALYSNRPEQALYATAKGQTEDLLSAVIRLEHYNNGTLSRDHIRRLIDDIRGVGAPVIDRQAEISVELNPLKNYQDPGSVMRPADTLIWNGLNGDNGLRVKDWSEAEIAAFEENNVLFLSDSSGLESLSLKRSKPVLNAKTRLILIASRERSSDHPIWTQIICRCKGVKLLSESDARELLKISTRETTLLSLPKKQREWQLPKSTAIPARDYSSYSSLDKFIFKPHQWVLNYAAKIRSGSLMITNEGNLLKGNLAHRLIETYLDQHPNLQKVDLDNIASWTDIALMDLIEKEGATLLEEGAFRDRVAFMSTMKTALKNLIEHLKIAGTVKTKTELWAESEFIGGALQGSIDIIAINEKGEEAIIDVKLGGLKYRRDELRNSQYLQLLTYDRLRQTSPHLSFFIVADSHMLNLAHDHFKNAERIDPDLGLTPDQYWDNIETLWKHRRAHFDKGLIEVTVEGTVPTERSLPDGIALDIPETNDAYSDYTALTGWEPSA